MMFEGLNLEASAGDALIWIVINSRDPIICINTPIYLQNGPSAMAAAGLSSRRSSDDRHTA
jgi:hypothetical protein